MKKIILKRISLALVLIFAAAAFAGCGNRSEDRGTSQSSASFDLTDGNLSDTDTDTDSGMDFGTDSGVDSVTDGESESNTNTAELMVSFGDRGNSFILHLYDNDTARAVAHHVGTADRRLPIYHYDDYDNWEVMQYYDIPSRY